MPDCVNLDARPFETMAARVIRDVERTYSNGPRRGKLRFDATVTANEQSTYGPALDFAVTDDAGSDSAAELVLSRMLKIAVPDSGADLVHWGPTDRLYDIGEFAALCLRLSEHDTPDRYEAPEETSVLSRLQPVLNGSTQVAASCSRFAADWMAGHGLRIATFALGLSAMFALLAAHGGLNHVAAIWP